MSEDLPPTLITDAAPELLGQAVGAIFAERYEIRAVLGEGGMGTVFRVHDRELDEEVALKLLHVGIPDELALHRFRLEVKLARRVTHPNVARTYDLGCHREMRFITMELVLGEALSSLAREGQRPPLPETLRILAEIARGLSAAHAAGVVHRDLKLANVMRARCGPRGGDGRVVITDFGIARLAEGTGGAGDGRTVGAIGTPAYMSPEQLMGEPVDGRTDVHALGVLAFQLLTGKLPFRGDSAFALVAARMSGEAPDPRVLDPGIPPAIAALVTGAMARRREDRPDAETVLQSLERLRGGGEAALVRARSPLGGLSLTGLEAARSGEVRSVAVAPPEVVAADRSDEDLAGAMADALSTVRGLRILPPAAVREAMKASPERDALAAARALRADWMVEATLRAEGGRRRARARLLDVLGGELLWASQAVEGPAGEAFALEDRLVRAVTEAVRERGGRARGPADPSAREAFDRASAANDLATVPHVREAIALLEEAAARHPGDPWIMGLLGKSSVRLWALLGSFDDPLAARAEEMLLRALAADPSLGEPYGAIGLLRLVQGEYRAGVRALQESLARAPFLAESHAHLGQLLIETGHVAEGMARLDVALRLEPRATSPMLERARTKALLGDRSGAEEDLRRVAAQGGELTTHLLLVRLVVWWNDRPRAAALADTMERSATGATWEKAIPALRAVASATFDPSILALFHELASTSSLRARCRMVEVASEYLALMGEREGALEWLERAESLPFVDVFWLDRCPTFADLRGEPRFARIRALVATRAAELWP